MRIVEGKKTLRYYVDGGFVEVSDNLVTVLTNRAIKAEDLNPEALETDLEVARAKPANTGELMEIRDRAVAQSRGQLWVARRNR